VIVGHTHCPVCPLAHPMGDPAVEGWAPVSIPITIRRLMGAIRADRGATTAEYALVASLIAIVVLTAVLFLGTNLLGLFDSAGSSYADAT
jgi:pilus assembly protein Flp/PilA